MCKCNNNNNTVTTTECHVCAPKPCKPPVDCSCPVIINTDCVTYNGDDLACSGIEAGLTLTETLQALDAYICEAISDINATINLVNVGTGKKLYAGIDALGKRKIRSIITQGALLTSVENIDDVTLGIDEVELSEFVRDTQNNFDFTGENLGTGAKVYKETTGLAHKFRTIKTENVGAGVGIFNTIEEGTDEIKIKAKTLVSSDSSVQVTENATTIDLKSTGGGTSINLQKIILTDYTLSDVDDKHTIFIDNGSDKVFITIPLGLKPNFFCVFLQQGTGEVMFTNDVGVTIFTPIGYYIKGQYYWAHLEKVESQELYHLLATVNPLE